MANVSGPAPMLRGLRAAVVVLTRVPAGGFPYSDAEWRWSVGHLPAAGALVGGISALAWRGAERAGPLAAAAVAVAASMLATGALHEDGLADTADALGGGGGSRERVLAILKDSRIGAFGACAVAISIVLRTALVARLAPEAPAVLVLAGAASRLGPAGLLVALPYATDPAVAKNAGLSAAGLPQLALAVAWTLAIAACAHAFGLAWAPDLAVALAASALSAVASGAYFRARLGGVTGDFLGAAQQVAECAVLLAIAVARGGPAS